MLVWKEVCRPNTDVWYVNQATKQPARLKFTPDYIKHLHDQGKAMLGSGLSIPVPLEHQPDAAPLTEAERQAKQLLNNAGWVKDFAIDKDGRLLSQLDIQDEDTYRRLPRTIRYTSPYIHPKVVDGNGKEWNGVITHMALTSRPRITKQEPFGAVAAALSLAEDAEELTLTPTSLLPDGGMSFSAAGSLKADGDASLPLYPAAFSVLSGAALAEGFDGGKKAPPKKNDKPGGDKPAGKKPPAKSAAGPPDEGDEEGEEGGEFDAEQEQGVESMVEMFCELLSAKFGIEIPPGCDESSVIQHGIKAIISRIREEEGHNMPDPTAAGNPPASAGSTTVRNNPQTASTSVTRESPPLYMSHEDVEKIADPTVKAVARDALVQRQRAERLEKNLLGDAARKRDERYAAVLPRVPKAFQVKLAAHYERTKAAEGAGLSLADDGSVADAFESLLSLAEECPDVPALLAADPEPHPREAAGGPGEMTQERAEQVLNEQLAASGRREAIKTKN